MTDSNTSASQAAFLEEQTFSKFLPTPTLKEITLAEILGFGRVELQH